MSLQRTARADPATTSSELRRVPTPVWEPGHGLTVLRRLRISHPVERRRCGAAQSGGMAFVARSETRIQRVRRACWCSVDRALDGPSVSLPSSCCSSADGRSPSVTGIAVASARGVRDGKAPGGEPPWSRPRGTGLRSVEAVLRGRSLLCRLCSFTSRGVRELPCSGKYRLVADVRSRVAGLEVELEGSVTSVPIEVWSGNRPVHDVPGVDLGGILRSSADGPFDG